MELAPIAGKLNLGAPRRIAEIAKHMGADIIHSHLSSASVHACTAGRQARVPVVAHVHAMSSPRWYQRADLVVACSRGVADHLRRHGLRPPVEVVYNGVSLDEFNGLPPPNHIRAALGCSETAPLIGVVASLVPRKGHRHLLEALPRLTTRWPDLTCVVVGAGPLETSLRRLAECLGVARNVRFLGFREDRIAIMQAMDLLVLPSVAIEGFGLVLVEAAVVGVPSIASNLPGIDEVVVDGVTGRLVPPADPLALSAAIGELLEKPAVRLRMGHAARQRALEQFTIDQTAAKMEDRYRRVLGL